MLDTLAHPFMKTRDRHGSEVRYLDVPAFAEALAEALGGKVKERDQDSMDRDSRACIEVEGFSLMVWHTYHTKGDRVEIHGRHPDAPKLSYDQTPRDISWPTVTVSTGRPMEALVKDIRKRVIEACEEPAIKLLAAIKARQDSRAALEEAMQGLHEQFPALSINAKPDEVHSASLYLNHNGLYLSGDLRSGGDVSIQRIGSLSAERFRLVMEALTKPLID